MSSYKIVRGHVIDGLRLLADASVDCIVTSPPYWGLRDYGLPPQVWGGDAECDHRWRKERFYREGGASVSSAERHQQVGEANAARLKKTRWRSDVWCDRCGAWQGSLGLEPNVELFTEHLLMVMAECLRVLKPTGVCWVNMGDGYNAYNSSRGRSHSEYESRVIRGRNGRGAPKHARGLTDPGLKVKDLIGQPWRVALAMQGFAVVPFRRFSEWADDLKAAREAGDWDAVEVIESRLRAHDLHARLSAQGWWLRQDVVWSKPSAMPESVTDRCTRSHEYVFMLSKRDRYWYDAEAIKTPIKDDTLERMAQMAGARTLHLGKGHHPSAVPTRRARRNVAGAEALVYQEAWQGRKEGWNAIKGDVTGANARTVWDFASEGSTCGACDSCGKVWASNSPAQCSCGAEVTGHYAAFPTELPKRCILAGCPETVCTECGAPYERALKKKVGWQPTCKCSAGTRPGTVLDPFGGTGTTGVVAYGLGRDVVLCELNPLYADLAEARLSTVTPSLFAGLQSG